MDKELDGRIEGAFTGFHEGAVFRLTNGQAWQQRRYKYRYHYAYRPEVQILRDGGGYLLTVAGMDESIEVVRVTVAVEGPIISEFVGFNQNMQFQFQNGQIWEQAEYKYAYHYGHRPNALVVDGISGYQLNVDGMSETVRVRRVR